MNQILLLVCLQVLQILLLMQRKFFTVLEQTMSDAVQYLTNQKGDRVGVLLDLETYHRLAQGSASDPGLLTG